MAHDVARGRSRTVTMAAAGVAVVLLTGAQSSCESRRQQGSTTNSQVSVSVVEYSVTSDARIDKVTFVDENGKTVTRSNVGRSWSGSGPAKHGTVMISATTGTGSSMIKCSVKVRGTVVQRASAVGGGSTTVVCKTTY